MRTTVSPAIHEHSPPAVPDPTQQERERAMKPTLRRITFAAALVAGLAAAGAQAQTTVKEPWVRGTVAQQKATGMFAQITSASGGKLVSASSAVAGVVEIHEMKMDGGVMKMRAMPAGLELPAGKTVELKPGGYHVMLLDLKQQLKEGETVALTLVVQGKDGKSETIEVKAPVRPLAAPGMSTMPAAMPASAAAHKH